MSFSTDLRYLVLFLSDTMLINLVTSSSNGLGTVNDLEENKITISKAFGSEYVIIDGLSSDELTSLRLFNLLGQAVLIKEFEVSSQTQRVLVSSLQSGIYIALLEAGGSQITKKIVIN